MNTDSALEKEANGLLSEKRSYQEEDDFVVVQLFVSNWFKLFMTC